ncbi:hypothetical protein QAD02_000552 [Eretmocerus hayati]|uniref:Uncharacterized protein n=1 Tax=Eretmocerus hayati TaxID=131215 RepID=A0ACC2NDR5_9HYME|nr:hypothetical protein QAD02_000552 [Eretmocerus hayati]
MGARALHRPSCVSRLPSDTTFEICNVLTGQQHQSQNNDGPSEDSEVWTGLNADHQDTVLGDMSPNSDQLGVNERNQTLNKLVNKAYDRSHIHQASGVNLDESAVHQHQTSQSTNATSIVDTTGAIPQSASRSGLIMRSTDGDSSRIISGNTCGSIESNNKKCSSPGLITSQSCFSHQGIPTSTTRIQNQLSQCHEIRHQALRVEARPVRLRGCGCKRTVLARLAPTLCCYRTTLSSTTTAVYRPKSLLTALRPRI